MNQRGRADRDEGKLDGPAFQAALRVRVNIAIPQLKFRSKRLKRAPHGDPTDIQRLGKTVLAGQKLTLAVSSI